MSKLFQRILVALPADDNAAIGLSRIGMSIARTHDATVRLVSVVPIGVATTPSAIGLPGTGVRMPDAPKVTDAAVSAREQLLNQIQSAHSSHKSGGKCVKVGDPPAQIISEADRWGADLIIVGARDRDWVSRLFERSISQEVAKSADCAVLIFPEISEP